MTIVSPDRLARYVTEALAAGGAAPHEASVVSDVLTWADRRGRYPQGCIWVDVLLKRIEAGVLSSPLSHEVESVAPGRATFDAANGFGHVAATIATDAAIEMASEVGIATVSVSNSSHFGAAGFYASRIADRSMLGIACTNAFPKVAAHGGADATLGTNPLAFALPNASGAPIVGDLSTGALAGSRVRESIATNSQLPDGMLLDANGHPTTDPNALGAGGVMLPAAGAKGFALSLLVEGLTGAMVGGPVGRDVGSVFDVSKGAGVSHCVIAIATDAEFSQVISKLADDILASPPSGQSPVRLPGSAGHDAEAAARDGIELPDDSVASIRNVLARVDIESPL